MAIENQSKEVTEFDSSSSTEMYGMYGEQKAFMLWWNIMMRYYGLSYEDDNIRIDMMEYQKTGRIIFDEKYEITLFCHMRYDKFGREVMQMGIPINKVIQM